jgi:uncharacterized membrane protein HdeD (DUF308 family)
MFWRAAVTAVFAIGAFAWPILTLASLLMLFGLFALADGAVSLVLAAREVPSARSALVAEGVFGLTAGASVVLFPRIALAAAAAVLCGWAVALAVLLSRPPTSMRDARSRR